MSDEPLHQKRSGRGHRRRNKSKQPRRNDDRGSSSYRNVSFRARPSSGRPGTPHRYFDESHDVFFDDGGSDPPSALPSKGPGSSSADPTAEKTSSPQKGNIADRARSKCRGNQVVHRHLNGLCVVTAGDVLEKMIQSNHDDEREQVGISSIQWLVNVGKDSASARGKMRIKNKKQKLAATDGGDDAKGSGKEVGDHDGNVTPRDLLCRITLSNGTDVQLNCCVLGTVIELNHRLDSKTVGPGEEAAGDPSLILKEPLLDGYLAVIIPARGSFPKGKTSEDVRI